jgi:DNA-binding transcriptional ArsR family regulator
MRRLLDVLCDPTRLKIVRALRDNQLAASDLARILGRSRSATSQHLRVLREADVAQPQWQRRPVSPGRGPERRDPPRH